MPHVLTITKQQLLELAEVLEQSWRIRHNGKFAYAGQRTMSLLKRPLNIVREEIKACAKDTLLEALEKTTTERWAAFQQAVTQLASTPEIAETMRQQFNADLTQLRTEAAIPPEEEEKVKLAREKVLGESITVEVFKVSFEHLPDNTTMEAAQYLQPMLADE